MKQLIEWKSLCNNIDCKGAFENLSAGVPTLIALFLIIYAHRVLSTKLKEATGAGETENATLYRQQLGRVWSLALFLLIVHAGLFIYSTTKPSPRMISGAIYDLESNTDIGLLGGGSIFKKHTIGENTTISKLEWVVLDATNKITLRIRDEQFRELDCEIKVASGLNPSLNFQAVFDGDGKSKRLSGLRDSASPTSSQPVTCFQLPRSRKGILDDLASIPFAEPPKQTTYFLGFVGAAWAQSASQPVELDVLLKAINSDSYELRSGARKILAENLSYYSDWIQSVATGNRRPTENEIGALTWAVSRQNPDPWKDMNQTPDLSSDVVNFIIRQLLSDSEYVRENAKRFIISYPTPKMETALSEVLDPKNKTEQERYTISLAHFHYNKGVFITMANENGRSTDQTFENAQEHFSTAARIVLTLPKDSQIEFARIDFAKGWAKAIASNTADNPAALLNEATVDISRFLASTENSKGEYPYPWQISTATSFIKTRDPAAFK